MITKEDVVSAYNLLLRREPESDEAINSWLKRCADPEDLVKGILGSSEFKRGIYKRVLQSSQTPLSEEEIISRFGVRPEPLLVNWLRNLPDIEGMLLPGSAYISAVLAQIQARNGYGGNIIEIGVYHGKHLAGLATSLRPNEKAIAVDIFEDQDLNKDMATYADGGFDSALRNLTQDAFTKNMSAYCPSGDVLIFKRSSLEIRANDLMPDGQKARFFSVDGGHTREVLLNDLRLAEDTLAPHGIVSIDDIMSEEWPGVITGTVQYFDGDTNLRPVAFIANKLLCAFAPFTDFYRDALLRIAPRSLRARNVEFSNYTADRYVDGDDLHMFLKSLPA